MRAGRPASERLRSAVRRRVWIVTEVFLAAAVLITAAVYLIPSRFRSEATVHAAPADVADVLQTTQSRTTFESLLEEFPLAAASGTPAARDRALAMLREHVGAEAIADDQVRVWFTATDPDLSQRVTDRLARLAVESAGAGAASATAVPGGEAGAGAASTNALTPEIEQVHALVEAQRARLEAYRASHPGERGAQLADTTRALRNAQAQAAVLDEQTARDRERLEQLSASGRGQSGESAVPPQIAQLTAARTALAELEARLTPAHPDVVRQRGVVQELEAAASRQAMLTRSQSSVNDMEAKALADRIASRELQRRRLQSSIAAMQRTIGAAPAATAELGVLTRDLDALQAVEDSLTAKGQTLSRAPAGRAPRHIVTPASRPSAPISPNRRGLLGIGFVVALAMALAVGVTLETRDTRIYDDDDLRDLTDVPLLGIVNEVRTPEEAAALRRPAAFRAVLAPAVAVALAIAWWWA